MSYGYELFSSFFPNGGVCAFIRSDVQTLHLKQFDLSNPGFQLFWLKISLPHATKYICKKKEKQFATSEFYFPSSMQSCWILSCKLYIYKLQFQLLLFNVEKLTVSDGIYEIVSKKGLFYINFLAMYP